MAEIKIEKKKPIWPWILLVIVILALIAFFAFRDQISDDMSDDYGDDLNTERYNDSSTTSVPVSNGTVYKGSDRDTITSDEFMVYDRSIKDSARIASDSSYTKIAFVNLAKAVARKANAHSLPSSKALERLKSYSEQTNEASVANTSAENGISKNFKSLTDNVTEVLEAIQTKDYPALSNDISALKQDASKIDMNSAMAEQPKQLQAFLENARDLLKSMNP